MAARRSWRAAFLLKGGDDMEYDYWASIPIGRRHAATYSELSDLWGLSRRGVRAKLHQLSEQDNGDSFVLIRSATNKGFYRTDDREEIERYVREVTSRATSHFAPLKKVRRILGEDEDQLRISL